jgi:hypothetical protein
MFAAGMALQLLGPHLKIANRAFVIPPKLTTEGNNIRLVEIIARQRHTQVISALLVLGGAIGLGVLYRDTLTGKASRQRANRSLGESDVIPREAQIGETNLNQPAKTNPNSTTTETTTQQ